MFPGNDKRMNKVSSIDKFWHGRRLEDLNEAEWENLCDRCGRCCLVKLEDEDTGEIHFTDVACRLFDAKSCRCRDYPDRQKQVVDCIKLSPMEVSHLRWLPPTCAYRLIGEGKDLPWWHPLVSGDPRSVHEAGVSVHGRVAASETDVPLEDYIEHIVKWPSRTPRARKPAR